MVTQIGRKARAHLYISEWMDDRHLNDEKLGLRLGKSRVTIWRWRSEQHRLNPQKIADIAHALGVEPEQLWHPPGRPSIDAMLKHQPVAMAEKAAEVVGIILKTVA